MAIGGVVINFVAKTADAVGDVNKLGRSLGGLGKDAGTAAGKKGIGGLVSSMGAALPIVGAVAIGVVGAATALVEMSKAAWEDKRQADRLSATLKNIPGITADMIAANEEWITSMQLATLVSDTDLRAAISKLTLATGDLGEAQKLATLATDVAAGSGKSYSAVADAMAKAAAGNTSQLERMFPWLDKNKDGTVSLKEAQEGLGKAFKGAAGEAAKNDPWKRIAIIWDELQEIIGSALLPVMEELSGWFASKKNQDKIKEFLERAAELAETVGVELLEALKDLVAWLKKPENQQKLKDWAEAAKDLAKFFGDVASAISSVISWMGKLPEPPKWLKPFTGVLGLNPFSVAPAPAAGPQATAAASRSGTAPTPQAVPTVIVTEEQVYRAVQRLLLRGDARNGRLVMVR